jgi:hypothetical protein
LGLRSTLDLIRSSTFQEIYAKRDVFMLEVHIKRMQFEWEFLNSVIIPFSKSSIVFMPVFIFLKKFATKKEKKMDMYFSKKIIYLPIVIIIEEMEFEQCY